jgi:hypothetical protein
MIGIRRGLPREGAAEVVAFVDAEPLELDAALAWARPVKPEDHAASHLRRHERAPHQGSQEDRLLRSSRRHSTIATFRSAWSRPRVRSEAPREGRTCRSSDLAR